MSQAARGHLAMLLFSALVAGSFSLGVQAANHIAPTALNAARFAIAAVLVGTAAWATTGLPRSAWRAPWRYLLLGGIFAIYFVLMFEGLKTASPVSASAVFTLTPILSAAAGYVLLRQITTRWMALALAIGGAGAVWVIFRADLAALLRFHVGPGEMVYFWGCVAHAIYTPLVRKLNRGEPAVVFTFGMLVAGCVVVTLWGWRDIAATDWANLPRIVWITLLYIAVCASSITFVLLQYASLRLPSAKVMAYTYLTPSWVLVWEFALGHGLPPALTLIGVGLSIAALVMLLRSDPVTPQPQPAP
ncbi:DMT family transporter [Thalassovita taeanensis]|uniref:EamA-like transporter family protein n=1 Tax=Thalassovita taeanensis TaxID=657014 RepID=A0A1H9DKC1_9RHOB|nr:DMT family transporter [Thalassovita taeanensis]SEQ13168.1 EamA-like transporter family protein [Thalassovita taeanensis]